MQNSDEKKAVMTEIIDCNDLDFSDWENFTDDIDISSLEHSLEITESTNDTFNEKIINFLSDGDSYSQKRGDIDQDSPTCGRVETFHDESFETQLSKFIPSLESNTLSLNDSNIISVGRKSRSADFLNRETVCSFPRKIDVSSTMTSNIFIPFSLTSNAEKSFSCPDDLQPKCKCYDARDERLVAQEYPNRKENNICIQGNSDRLKQNEENPKCSGILPYVSRLEVFDIQGSSASTQGSESMVSIKMIASNSKNISNENTSCKNITPFKENFNSERMIFLSEENFDSQKMIISSQESSDGQRVIISSQETSDSQRMIISSQETSDSQRMITSSQESSGSEKMIISSQEFSDSQKMITSSQDISDSQKMITLSQESFGSQKMIISSQESFDSKNLLISNQVPEDQKIVPSSHDTSVWHKMFNSKSGSFLKISKKKNLKTYSKSHQSIGSRLSLKDKKLNKFLDFNRLAGAMTTQCNNKKVSPPASIGKKYGNTKERKIIQIGELKVRKIEIVTNKQKKFISSRR